MKTACKKMITQQVSEILRIEIEGERLFPDGKKHQAAHRFLGRLQASGHHFRIRSGCGAGCVPCPQPW